MRYYSYQRQQPGCGGCLLLALLLLLLTGGAPLLFQVMGVLVFSAFFFLLLLLAAIWGFTYYIRRQIRDYERSQTEAHNEFVYLLINILTRIAQIDGTITREESEIIVGFFRDHLRYSSGQLHWVRELMKQARRSEADLQTLLSEFRARFAYEPRLILLELIYQVLFTKTVVPEPELRLAKDISGFLAISAYDQQRIERRYTMRQRQAAIQEEDYYRVLGVEPGADFDRIKAAYRQLSQQYHPDKVAHLGEEFRKVAEEKMKEINEAYQILKKKFGQA
jgi:DnaJ like chaperone protein